MKLTLRRVWTSTGVQSSGCDEKYAIEPATGLFIEHHQGNFKSGFWQVVGRPEHYQTVDGALAAIERELERELVGAR